MHHAIGSIQEYSAAKQSSDVEQFLITVSCQLGYVSLPFAPLQDDFRTFLHPFFLGKK